MTKKIAIVAGDSSADLYGGLLCKKIKEKFSDIEIFSFAGPKIAQFSHQKIDLLQHSVSGIFEVIAHLSEIIKVFNETVSKINEIKPDLVILMDFPDFNLKLAKALNKKFPIFYYISPQVWAWRKKRVELIKRYVEKMIVIFKFEEDFYKKEEMDVSYFGHPLLEIIKPQSIEPKKIISFLPGSRKNEILRHLPVMQEAKRIMSKKLSNYHFRIIKPENLKKTFYKKFSDMDVMNHSYDAIKESEFVITSSGTATVEIAILEVPFLIIYKVNPFTLHILRRLVKTDFIGMVNILASKKIIDELLQEAATPENIAEKTLDYIENKEKYQEIKDQLRKIKEIIGPLGATEKCADFIGDYLRLRKL